MLIFLLVGGVLVACASKPSFFHKKNELHTFGSFLQEVVNDTVLYKVQELQVSDPKIYGLLDSVIIFSKQCRYFDNRIPYLHSFEIYSKRNNDGKLIYSMDAHQSIEESLNLLFKKELEPNSELNKAVFYYRNYLFSVPFIDNRLSEDFNFLKITDTMVKVKATRLPSNVHYSSYLNFTKTEDGFIIKNNSICR